MCEYLGDVRCEGEPWCVREVSLAGHEVSRIVSCVVAKHADETAYIIVRSSFRSDETTGQEFIVCVNI